MILADGTGNAFGSRESNIWRLGKVLDQTAPDQAIMYVPGVGTSKIRAWALVDGATGFGVPSNVRDTYEFLCRNWRPGVDIYMFGFSRGAFTVRTLVGLMESEGLVACSTPDGPVSRVELRRRVAAAWRSYRAKDAAWHRGAPTIALARRVRNLATVLGDRLWSRVPYADVRRDMAPERFGVPIRFVGVFDTVEAFGVPVEALRGLVDALIWPLSFRNGVLGRGVAMARHALALDDERTTFHPVRFDLTGERPGADRVREVWFAGVHADVGGGYQEDGLALIPLLWIIDEATKSEGADPDGLRFLPDAVEGMRQAASPYGPVHDSRGGLAVLYRYEPRILQVRGDRNPPVIHHTVAERMVFGTHGYVPLTLPETAHVLMPDGRVRVIAGFEREPRPEAALPYGSEFADAAVERLSTPVRAYVSLVRDRIWLRRVAQLALLACSAFAVLLPWTAPVLDVGLRLAADRFGGVTGMEAAPDATTYAWVSVPAGWVSASDRLVPFQIRPWVDVALREPLLAVPTIAILAWLWDRNRRLRDGIADDARRAWFARDPEASEDPQDGAPRLGPLMRFARAMRTRDLRPKSRS